VERNRGWEQGGEEKRSEVRDCVCSWRMERERKDNGRGCWRKRSCWHGRQRIKREEWEYGYLRVVVVVVVIVVAAAVVGIVVIVVAAAVVGIVVTVVVIVVLA
jgi:hypothetical protein